MDRSSRNLAIVSLVVLAVFLALNHIARRSALIDWWTVAFFLLIALLIWFFDRLRSRGIDDSEVGGADVIEPLVYEHAGALPDTIDLVAPNPGTVIHAERHVSAPEVTLPEAPALEVQPPSAENSANRGSAESGGAQATPSTSAADAKVEPTPPAPDASQHPPATATETTTIQEKEAPTPSAPAPETHPDLAAKAPEGANVPSTPVKDQAASSAVPTSVQGTSPEPVASEAGHGATPSTANKTVSEPAAESATKPATNPASTAAPEVVVPPKTAAELGNPKAITSKKEAKAADKHPVEVPDRTPGISPEYPSKVDTKGQGDNAPETIPAPTTVAPEPPLATPGGKATPADPNLKVSATVAADTAPNRNDPNLPIKAEPAKPDDLKIIEGIGPKMEKALQAAGIDTYAMLSGASEAQIREAITKAGMRFAPSVPTWAEQASYAANGDFVGLEAYQKTLFSGRKSK